MLQPDELVPLQQLVAAVWEESLPAAPANQIAICISALRRALGQVRGSHEIITTEPPGYRIPLQDVELDSHRAESLHRAAVEHIKNGAKEEAVALLGSALTLWRGAVLAGIDPQVLQPAIRRLEELRLTLWDLWAELQLDLGAHEELVTQLSALTEQHPLLERPRAQLMRALFRVGRQADALKLFRDTRAVLLDELGIEPGAELQQLHREILRGELPAADGQAGPAPAAVTRSLGAPVPERPGADAGRPEVTRPCMLQNDAADFTGREAEISRLTELLTANTGGAPVVAVSGWGGVGKTALVLHVAHTLRDVFSDGQLFINLSGIDARPVPPTQVLARFLRELGVHGSEIPDGLEQRAEKYRSLLADRRILIVLDDAADAEQVQPLIPGTGSCSVLVTSRARLTTVSGPQLMELDLLDSEQALALLGRIVGAERVSAEPAAAAALVEYCGRLPLALRIAGAKLAAKRHWSLQLYTSRLADEQRRLDELSYGHLDVRASISLSYQGLSPNARALFRRLGLLEMEDFAAWVGAPLVDAPIPEVENLLEELIDAQLVTVLVSDSAGQLRYRLHDLVRLFALERAYFVEPTADRQAAITRVAGAWLGLLDCAHRSVTGGDYAVVHSSASPWRFPWDTEPWIGDPLGSYEAERHNLPSLCSQLAEGGLDELCWDLATTGVSVFGTRSHYDEWERTHESALAATRQAGNRLGEAAILLGAGDLHLTRRHYNRATNLLEGACRLFESLGARHGYALTLRKIACVDRARGHYEQALDHWRGSLAGLREFGDLGAQAHVLRWVGETLLELDDADGAEPYINEALEVSRALGGRGAAQALYGLGELHARQGKFAQAERELSEVMRLTWSMSDLRGQGHALLALGQLWMAQGQPAKAEQQLVAALDLTRRSLDGFVEVQVLLTLVELRRSMGQHDEAAALLAEATDSCERLRLPVWIARCRAKQAELLADEDPQAAEQARLLAVDAVRSIGSPLASRLIGLVGGG